MMKLSTIILIFIYNQLIFSITFDQVKSSNLFKSTRTTKRVYNTRRVQSKLDIFGSQNVFQLTKRARFCLWGCHNQNTTNLLLFTEPGNGVNSESRISKYTNTEELQDSPFDPENPTILLVHGFRGSGLSQQRWAIDIKDLVLTKQKANVFFADWNHFSRVLSYSNALEHIPEVARDMHSILMNYKSSFPGFNMNNIQVIGHSLGGHIGGLLGQMMDGKLDQITALDPPGIYLESTSVNSDLKLSSGDAHYVVAHHTDSKYLGTNLSIADRDIYFNGGDRQPACETPGIGLIPTGCRHRQSVKYSSIYMGKCIMVAYLCSNYKKFESGECAFCARNSDKCVGVGHEWQYQYLKPGILRPTRFDQNRKKNKGAEKVDKPWTNKETEPRYYLKTGPESPYCLFTYQVVVKFPGNFNLSGVVSDFELILKSNNPVGGLKIQLSNRLRPSESLEVFSESGNTKTEIVPGKNIFTALALLDKSYETAYDMMPVKFTEALLSPALLDRVGSSPKVFVNFMSHVSFEDRAKNSGPVEVKRADAARLMANKMFIRTPRDNYDRRNKTTRTASKS